MADTQKLFGGEIPICKLITEKHRHDRSNGKSDKDPSLLTGRETKLTQISKDKRQPGSPDKKLKHHHEPKLERLRLCRN